jgi:hypothetical protein
MTNAVTKVSFKPQVCCFLFGPYDAMSLPAKDLTARTHLQTLSTNSLQTNIRRFLFPAGNWKQGTMFASVDVFLNTSWVYRELPPRQVLRIWTSENTVKLTFCNQSFIATFKNRLVSSDKISEVSSIFYFQICQKIISIPRSFFEKVPSPPTTSSTSPFSWQKYIASASSSHTNDVMNWLISAVSGRETVFADSPQA